MGCAQASVARVTQMPTAAHPACLPLQVKVEQSSAYIMEKAREGQQSEGSEASPFPPPHRTALSSLLGASAPLVPLPCGAAGPAGTLLAPPHSGLGG